MRLRSRQRHPVQQAVDHHDKGWGSVPEVPLQPSHPTAWWEQGRETISLLQAGEEGQEEPPQEDNLDPKTAARQTLPDKLLENRTSGQA